MVGAVLVWADLSHAQPTGQSIEAILEAKAQRTPAQRKLSCQFLDATGRAQPSDSVTHRRTDHDANLHGHGDRPATTAAGTRENVWLKTSPAWDRACCWSGSRIVRIL